MPARATRLHGSLLEESGDAPGGAERDADDLEERDDHEDSDLEETIPVVLIPLPVLDFAAWRRFTTSRCVHPHRPFGVWHDVIAELLETRSFTTTASGFELDGGKQESVKVLLFLRNELEEQAGDVDDRVDGRLAWALPRSLEDLLGLPARGGEDRAHTAHDVLEDGGSLPVLTRTRKSVGDAGSGRWSHRA